MELTLEDGRTLELEKSGCIINVTLWNSNGEVENTTTCSPDGLTRILFGIFY